MGHSGRKGGPKSAQNDSRRPFNQEFRLLLLNTYFYGHCTEHNIPVTKDLDVVPFLTDESEMGEWNLEGLPSDNLSTQNGILVTRSSRWPVQHPATPRPGLCQPCTLTGYLYSTTWELKSSRGAGRKRRGGGLF